jgi:hypothetical protein
VAGASLPADGLQRGCLQLPAFFSASHRHICFVRNCSSELPNPRDTEGGDGRIPRLRGHRILARLRLLQCRLVGHEVLRGTVGSGTQGQPAVYTSTGAAVGSSNQTIDISALSGANWGAKLTACSTALSSGGTCIIPDSEASDGTETSVILGNNVNLEFPGSGIFNTCTISLGINSHVDLGSATLKAATSSCTLLKQTASVSEQTATKLHIVGGVLDCNSQTGATGINIGNVTNAEFEHIGIQNCTDSSTSTASAPTGGLVMQASQFDHFSGIKFFNVAYPVKCYNDPTGGGCNSNTFYDLNIASGCQVGTIFANRSSLTNLQMGGNYFFNPTVQNCAVAGQANFGNTNVCSGTGCQSSLTVFGGSPELNGTANVTVTFTNTSAVIAGTNSYTAGQVVEFNTTGTLPTNFATNTPYYVISTGLSSSQFEVSATSGGSAISAGSAGSGTQTSLLSAVVDGFTIRQSSIFVSDTIVYWDAAAISEASITPLVDVEANSVAILLNGGGGSGQTFSTSADGTGQTSIQGLNLLAGTTAVNPGTWLSYKPATSGTNQSSPLVSLCGNAWTGANAQDCWGLQTSIGTGTNPTTALKFTHSTAGSSGFAGVDMSGINQLSLPNSSFVSSSQWNYGASTLNGTGNADFHYAQADEWLLFDGGGTVNFGSTEFSTTAGCETSFGATTVNTGSATTTTGQSCLPANAYIDAVVYRVTTAITNAASFTVGVSGSTSKFCSTQSTLTLGATGICNAQINAGAPVNGSAAPVVVTFNATPGAGAIRIIVYYHTWTAPTS